MAVREVIEKVQYRKKNYVIEADIRGFFDNVDHEWLMRMLAHDIADKRFLKAGVMENGKYLDSQKVLLQVQGKDEQEEIHQQTKGDERMDKGTSDVAAGRGVLEAFKLPEPKIYVSMFYR